MEKTTTSSEAAERKRRALESLHDKLGSMHLAGSSKVAVTPAGVKR